MEGKINDSVFPPVSVARVVSGKGEKIDHSFLSLCKHLEMDRICDGLG